MRRLYRMFNGLDTLGPSRLGLMEKLCILLGLAAFAIW